MNEIGGRIYNDLEYTELAFSMETKQMMNSVSRAVCQVGFDKSVSLDDARTPLATWQATAFTLHSVVWSCLESGKKSILDPVEMASRHKECLSAMIRYELKRYQVTLGSAIVNNDSIGSLAWWAHTFVSRK